MKRWMLTGIALFILAGMVLVDQCLWAVARLERYIGKQEGLSGAVDDQVVPYVGPSMKRSELEEELRRAVDPKEVGRISQELFKHLGDMGKTNDRPALMESVVERFPGNPDRNILQAHVFLAKLYLKRKNKAKLLELLRLMLPLAEGPPPNERLLNDMLRCAEAAGLNDFMVSLASKAHAWKGLQASSRLSILGRLERYYARMHDTEKLAQLATVREQYLRSAKLADVIRGRQRAIDALIKKKEWDGALAELKNAMAEFATYKDRFYGEALKLADAATKRGDLKVLKALWEQFRSVPSPGTARGRNAASKLIEMLLPAVLDGGDARALDDLERGPFKEYPDLAKRLGYFFAGERWARGGQKGAPPKRLYVVKHRPRATVVVDGKLDEAVYAELASLDGPFWVHAGGSTKLTECPEWLRPTVKFFYTDTDFFISVEVPEPNMGAIRVQSPAGRVEHAWEDDSIEFFIEFNRSLGHYQQWVVTAKGGWTHLRLRGGVGTNLGPKDAEGGEAEMTAATVQSMDRYSMEVRIPLTHFPVSKPLSGKLMNANIRRMRWQAGHMKTPDLYRGQKLLTISWAKLGHGHNTQRFEFLRFE